MTKYELPRFISETAVEEMSKDNYEWLNGASCWCKFYPDPNYNAVFMNVDHPLNKGKGFNVILAEYKKMHGI